MEAQRGRNGADEQDGQPARAVARLGRAGRHGRDGTGVGAGHRAARPERRPGRAGADVGLPAERLDDPAAHPPAAAGNAVRGVRPGEQRRRLHAQRPVLRALALGRHPRAGGPGHIPRCGARPRQPGAVADDGRHPGAAPGGAGRRQPVLRQLPRPVPAAHRRRTVGERRDGQCEVDRRAAARRAGPRRREARRRRGPVQRSRPARGGRRAGLHEVACPGPRQGRRGHAGLPDERRAVAAAERLPAAPGRARLVLDLLGQDGERH